MQNMLQLQSSLEGLRSIAAHVTHICAASTIVLVNTAAQAFSSQMRSLVYDLAALFLETMAELNVKDAGGLQKAFSEIGEFTEISLTVEDADTVTEAMKKKVVDCVYSAKAQKFKAMFKTFFVCENIPVVTATAIKEIDLLKDRHTAIDDQIAQYNNSMVQKGINDWKVGIVRSFPFLFC